MSAKIGTPALENFKLFYEEIIKVKTPKTRIRRLRQVTAARAN